MQRRKFIRNTGLTLTSLALLNKSSLASYLTDPTWKIRMLTDDIGIFTEKGGTIAFLLSKDGNVVVDAQFPDTAGHLISECRKKNDNPFSILINTHHHGDHTAGNIAFADMVKHAVAHENSRKNQERVAKEQKKEEAQLYPDILFSTIWGEEVNKEKITLHYFGAGHTNGDAIVHFEHANIVHMGDLVFNRRHPYIDKSAGAEISNWIRLLNKTESLFSSSTLFICGHAGDGYDILLKKEDIQAFRDYLGNLLKFVGDEIKLGKGLEEILKAHEIPGSSQWLGEGIDRPIKAAYLELTS